MKELSIEEKAKACDKVVERAKKVLLDCTPEERKVVEYIFPELKESEDEIIRKEMLQELKDSEDSIILTPLKRKRWISWLEKQKAIDVLDEEEREFADNVDSYRKEVDAAYQTGYNEGVKATLEKQGEQKPIKEHNVCDFCEDRYGCVNPCPMKLIEAEKPAWSEEDDKYNYNIIIGVLKSQGASATSQDLLYERQINWLKSLKDRIQPQSRQEWSKEDEEHIDTITSLLEDRKKEQTDWGVEVLNEEIAWFKSIKDRVQPKQEWGEDDKKC